MVTCGSTAGSIILAKKHELFPITLFHLNDILSLFSVFQLNGILLWFLAGPLVSALYVLWRLGSAFIRLDHFVLLYYVPVFIFIQQCVKEVLADLSGVAR